MTPVARCLMIALALAAGMPAARGASLTLGLNWLAQPELGGFYQAAAGGLYAAEGLDVRILDGGPDIDSTRALEGGRTDMAVLADPYDVMRTAADGAAVVTVAAFFQRNPQVLMAHPGRGIDGLAALRGRPIQVAQGARETWWRWLVKAHGFSDSQLVPQSSSIRRFIASPDTIVQAYLTDEPFQAESLGLKPVVVLLADYGFPPYSTLLAVRRSLVDQSPETVRRIVRATARGWHDYLYGDRRPADAVILASNHDVTPARIDYAVTEMKQRGIVGSGDAERQGIGVMTPAEWDRFAGDSVALGLYPASLDWRAHVRFDLSETGIRAW